MALSKPKLDDTGHERPWARSMVYKIENMFVHIARECGKNIFDESSINVFHSFSGLVRFFKGLQITIRARNCSRCEWSPIGQSMFRLWNGKKRTVPHRSGSIFCETPNSTESSKSVIPVVGIYRRNTSFTYSWPEKAFRSHRDAEQPCQWKEKKRIRRYPTSKALTIIHLFTTVKLFISFYHAWKKNICHRSYRQERKKCLIHFWPLFEFQRLRISPHTLACRSLPCTERQRG